MISAFAVAYINIITMYISIHACLFLACLNKKHADIYLHSVYSRNGIVRSIENTVCLWVYISTYLHPFTMGSKRVNRLLINLNNSGSITQMWLLAGGDLVYQVLTQLVLILVPGTCSFNVWWYFDENKFEKMYFKRQADQFIKPYVKSINF